MAPLLALTFSKSPSAQYDHAVHLAETVPGYKVTGIGREIEHEVATTATMAEEATWEKLNRLLRLVSGWRSARLTVNGRAQCCWSFSAELAQIKACHVRRARAGTGDLYCSGKSAPGDEPDWFGCRHAQGASVAPAEEDSWVRFGTLSKKRDAFRVDKKAIEEALQDQTKSEACLFCPAFEWRRVRADVAALPAVIQLGEKSPFELRYSTIDPTKALGIRLKESADDSDLVFGLDDLTHESEPARVRNVPNIRYADIAGQNAALAAIKNVIQLPLSHAAYFEALGAEAQNGILLYGPPGNGKTLLAKAVANESDAHLELINGPEVLSKWVGQSEENLRRVFARAKQFAPSVILIDELDAIAPRREHLSQQHDVQLIAQLLVLLDGLEARGRVAVVATTNRLEAIDPAVCRPGRFDYLVEVPSPARRGRAAILRVHLRKLKTSLGVQIKDLALRTAGFSGAELAALCRQAGLDAVRRGIAGKIPAHRLRITSIDLDQALQSLRTNRAIIES